ncbi:hypothetical protein BU26DRAFT_78430 [Trematosphaeria pertusa]|uniref:Uncharacterized protein n=1 Tax=Trematosphaeria pertusa TaxID=390896 RepID=A0A6A6I3V6_9PLEO|nr:uncharacterized protein BU26DRAFT_78430 [Trematosphaeria pertusa]KAF2245195.1 hypothetical protein BU26DRAFT_78430 [Trematosphaeria pertusa]
MPAIPTGGIQPSSRTDSASDRPPHSPEFKEEPKYIPRGDELREKPSRHSTRREPAAPPPAQPSDPSPRSRQRKEGPNPVPRAKSIRNSARQEPAALPPAQPSGAPPSSPFEEGPKAVPKGNSGPDLLPSRDPQHPPQESAAPFPTQAQHSSTSVDAEASIPDPSSLT